jgi:hypothetical protein
MTISRTQIATISEWKSNCAVAVMGDFVAEKLKNKELRTAAIPQLLKLFRETFAALSEAELITLLGDDYFATPNHAQEILGTVFRNYLQKTYPKQYADMVDEKSNQLTIDAFAPIANLLGFGVRFYMEEKSDDDLPPPIKVMPTLEINKDSKLRLDVVWHNSSNIKNVDAPKKRDYHFDRIMPNQTLAVIHDSYIDAQNASFAHSDAGKDLQLARDNQNEMKAQIQSAIFSIRGMKEEKHYEEEKEEKKVFTSRPTGTRAPTPLTFPTRSVSTTEEKKPATADGDDATSSSTTVAKPTSSTVTTPPSSPTSLKSTSISLSAPTVSWEELVSKKISKEHLSIKKYEKDARLLELRELQLREPTKNYVMYTIWKNSKAEDQVVLVDSATQIEWDLRLAQEIDEKENAEARACRRP